MTPRGGGRKPIAAWELTPKHRSDGALTRGADEETEKVHARGSCSRVHAHYIYMYMHMYMHVHVHVHGHVHVHVHVHVDSV